MRESDLAALVIAASISTTAAAALGITITSCIAIAAGEFKQLAGPVAIAGAGALWDLSNIHSPDASANIVAPRGSTSTI